MPIVAQRDDIQTFGAISLRLAVVDDAFLLWQWANDPMTRANSFNTEAISWDVHQNWYAKKLASPDCRLWIMELEQIPVGQIRYDRISADSAQISFSVAPVVRGRGLGTLLLELTAPMAARELGVRWMRGIAFSENQASQRAFAKARFTVAEHKRLANRECLVYQRGS
ncbi:MAG TPA: GNAT family N-acetyltransferase [Candidatus Binatia bacterium]